MMLEALIEAFTTLFSWPTLGFMILGVILGILVGATPGIGSALGIALLLPLTISLGGIDALLLLVGIYSGSSYAGSVAAILINTPGSASAAAATFDGYPMARKGKAKDALSAAATASALGGFFGIIVLILISPYILEIVLLFGSPQYFLLALLGLVLISVVAQGAVLKGIIAGSFGLLLTTIGFSPMGSTQRYTFGSIHLLDGLSFVAALLGLFALAEMFKLAVEGGSISKSDVGLSGSALDGAKETVKRPIIVLKSSIIGILIGAIPGAGATISTFIAYIETVRSSDEPETFGRGNIDGVVAVDSASNATISGSLIPTISFGIPGSAATAVLLGALIMHGLDPGPDLFGANIDITYTLLLGIFFGNFVILIGGIFFISRISYVTQIDSNIIIPVVIVLAATGSFMLRNNWVDPITLLLVGFLGYYMKKYNYSIIAFVLGIVLGEIAEANLIRSMHLSEYSPVIFVESPLSIFLLLCTVFVLFGPMVKEAIQARRG